MAAFNNLPFTLSAEDAALFKSLQRSALLPELAKPGEGEMVQLFKQKKREEQANIMMPYADILEAILAKNLASRSASIMEELRKSKDTSFTAKLFSWNTVQYHETLSHLAERTSKMTAEEWTAHNIELQKRGKTIADEGYENYFSVEGCYVYGYTEDDEPDVIYPEVKVDRIFRQSDLAMRLSLKLGPNFFPFTKWERITEATGSDGSYDPQGYTVYKKTLCVRYYPFGVSKKQLERLLAVAKNQADREANYKKTALRRDCYGVGHAALFIQPEPEATAPVSLLGGGGGGAARSCFCGCDDE